MEKLDLELIQKSTFPNPWDLGNQVLYDLCYNQFGHDTIEKVVNKVWLIGRAYAAAVERRKRKTEELEMNDFFYLKTVGPALRESKLDQRLKDLWQIEELSADKINVILETHDYLVKILRKITGQDKRSFSSKYLHFHLPRLYYIYDTRAHLALKKLKTNTPMNIKQFALQHNIDKEYAMFFAACYNLSEHIKKRHGLQLTPRQLDNLLLEIAHAELRKTTASGEIVPESVLLSHPVQEVHPVMRQEPTANASQKKTSIEERIAFLQPLIESGQFTQLELVDKAVEQFPHLMESTIRTFLVDSKNPKYNKFQKLVTENDTGKLTFIQ